VVAGICTPIHPEATMNTQNSISSVAALVDSNAAAETPSPSTIPPGPQSRVLLCGTPSRSASSNPSAAAPCATFWPRAEAAATVHASQVLSVAADEIDWLYENTDDETDPECVQARATIEAWLSELSPEHQLAIALHHDPMPWPEELRGSRRGEPPRTPGHEEDSFALVLHLLCPSTERDMLCYTPEQLALRAHRRLEIQLERDGTHALRTLIRRARWLFLDAVGAYAEVRGRVASVVPETSSSFEFEHESVPSIATVTMARTGPEDVTAARGDPKWLALVGVPPPLLVPLSPVPAVPVEIVSAAACSLSHREGVPCS
jgi:hypothetical protein